MTEQDKTIPRRGADTTRKGWSTTLAIKRSYASKGPYAADPFDELELDVLVADVR